MLAARIGPKPSTSRSRSGVGLDDIENLVAEDAHELLGVDRPHAPNHPRGKVFLNAICRSRRRCPQEPCVELLTVSAVIDPIARSGDPLTGGNACSMANHRHDVTMPSALARRTQKPFSAL
jgi:hypothetical protein